MRILTFLLFAFLPVAVEAQQCGGSFSSFLRGLEAEAVAKGIPANTAAAFFKGVQQDPAVLRADRRQGVFQKPFIEFSRRLISQSRIDRGRSNSWQARTSSEGL